MGKVCDSLFGNSEEKKNASQNLNGQNKINNINNNIEKNEDNTNNNAPKLKQYNPKLLESLYSKRSIESSQGEEILIQGGQINPDYKYDEEHFTNDNFKSLLKNKNSDNNQKPLAESYSYTKNGKNEIIPIDDKKAKTVVKSVKPNFPIKNLPNWNNSNNSRINVSIHESGSANNSKLYIPKRDNQPISNLENISDNYDLV